MNQVTKLHIAKTRTSGGRESGTARSSDGRLDVIFATPGAAWIGTSPEQLLGAAWSASFESAIALAAQKRTTFLPAGLVINAEVDLNGVSDGYFPTGQLDVSLPGLDRATAQALIDEARAIRRTQKKRTATSKLPSS